MDQTQHLIEFKKGADFELVGKTKESKPINEMDKVFEVMVNYFDNEATFTQRIKTLKEGKITISGTYEYQICTDVMCEFPPAEKFSLVIDSKCKSGVATSRSFPMLYRYSNNSQIDNSSLLAN
jgi:hypothetical protein